VQRRASRRAALPSPQQPLVERSILRHHRIEAEQALRADARGPSGRTRGIRIARERKQGLCQRVRIVGRHDRPGLAVCDQLGVAADIGRDDRQSARHRFEDRVRDAFGERRQHEHVEAAEDRRHVIARTGQPREVLCASRRQH
jgi:hypothetical protein